MLQSACTVVPARVAVKISNDLRRNAAVRMSDSRDAMSNRIGPHCCAVKTNKKLMTICPLEWCLSASARVRILLIPKLGCVRAKRRVVK